MEDAFTRLFAWIGPVLRDASAEDPGLSPEEREVFLAFRNGWGTVDTEGLLKGLTARHGELAGRTIERVLSTFVTRDWAASGGRDAHPGTELEDFLAALWGPLPALGFAFTSERVGAGVRFCVTKCPVFELAERTGTHRWLFHLACATDLYNYKAFSPRLEFRRTKTLVEGFDCCNHEYHERGAP